MAEKKQSLKEKKELAKLLYVRENVTVQKVLAARSGLSEKTIGKLIKDEGWDKLKRNILVTREEQMHKLLAELEELNDFIEKRPKGQRFANSKEADVRRKLIKDVKDLETKASLAGIIDTGIKMVKWLSEIDADKSREVMELFDKFIKASM